MASIEIPALDQWIVRRSNIACLELKAMLHHAIKTGAKVLQIALFSGLF